MQISGMIDSQGNFEGPIKLTFHNKSISFKTFHSSVLHGPSIDFNSKGQLTDMKLYANGKQIGFSLKFVYSDFFNGIYFIDGQGKGCIYIDKENVFKKLYCGDFKGGIANEVWDLNQNEVKFELDWNDEWPRAVIFDQGIISNAFEDNTNQLFLGPKTDKLVFNPIVDLYDINDLIDVEMTSLYLKTQNMMINGNFSIFVNPQDEKKFNDMIKK